MISLVDLPAPSSNVDVLDRSLRRRAIALLQNEIQFIPNNRFHAVEAENEILGARDATVEDKAESTFSQVPEGLPAHLARLCETELLTSEQETNLFRKMNYLKFRVNAIRSQLDPEHPDRHAIETAEDYLSQVKTIRDRIITSNTRLAMSVVKKFSNELMTFDEMLSDGVCCLMKCVDKFDYDRGYRFSTYAYRSIARNIYRKIANLQQKATRFVNNGSDTIIGIESKEESGSLDESKCSSLRSTLAELIGRLDSREQFILYGRFPLGGDGNASTFQSLGDELGISKERVRQIEQRAIEKLRRMAEKTELVDFSDLLA